MKTVEVTPQQERREQVVQLLAEARARQRRRKPELEHNQIWITLPDYLSPNECQQLLDGIEAQALARPAPKQGHVTEHTTPRPEMTDEQRTELVIAGLLAKHPALLERIEKGASEARQRQTADVEQPAPGPEERLQISKGRGELIPLLRFLKGCTFREKLAGVAMSVLGYNDVSDALGPHGGQVYDGSLGDDLQNDWEEAIFAAVKDEVGTPEECVLAAYLAGLSNAR